MKRITAISLVFCLVFFFTASIVSADSWPQSEPFSIVSSDGSRVFHVRPEGEWALDAWAQLPRTGLYYNTDPLIPIYFVENPCHMLWAQDFIFSDDMQYFAWIPQMNAENNNLNMHGAVALVFYANGVRQKTYLVSDLIRNENAVSFTTSTVQWIYSQNRQMSRTINFDTENNHLTIETVERETLVFDITNGAIVEGARQTFTLQASAIIVGGLSFFVLGITFLKRAKRSIEKEKR